MIYSSICTYWSVSATNATVVDKVCEQMYDLLGYFRCQFGDGQVIAKSDDMQPAAVAIKGGITFGWPHTDDGVAGNDTCRANLWPGKRCKEFLETSLRSWFVGLGIIGPAKLIVGCIGFTFIDIVAVIQGEVKLLDIFVSASCGP